MKIIKIFRNTYVQIFLVFMLASLFRLTNINLIEFKYDEALSFYQTNLFFIDGTLPQKGIMASTGMYNFPLFSYLLILIGLFSRNPLYMTFLIALINVGVIILFYILIKRVFGTSVAFVSAITLAVSPWAIIFSRKIWAQDLILFFAIPIFYFLIKSVENKKAYKLTLLSFLLFLLTQLHASGAFLMTSIIFIFILFKINFTKAKLIRGFIFASIFAFPYLIYQLSSLPFCRDCVAFLQYQKADRIFDFINFLRPFQILNGLDFQFLLGIDYLDFQNYNILIKPIGYIFLLEVFTFIISFLFYVKNNRSKIYLFLIFVIIPVLYFVSRTPGYMHYYVILLPLVAVSYALSFNYIYSIQKSNFFKASIVIIFLIFFLSKIIFITAFFQYLNMKQSLSGDYGPAFLLTENLTSKQLEPYYGYKDYNEIKQFSYIFINTKIYHQKMAELFLNLQKPEFAILEYKQALQNNEQDLNSRINLAYLYIQLRKTSLALDEIDIIEKQNATVSAKLKGLIKE
ncbi:MAG: hypothetical protein PHQ59_03900 [Candidatus Daviesbacteria bacterium]|nr:hypothetical protein [Candidatus Daviesbacteria bacterium]